MTAAQAERLRLAVAAHAAVLRRLSVVPATAAGPSPARRPAAPEELERILGVVREETEHGPVFLRDEWCALGQRHGAPRLGDALDASAEALALLCGRATSGDAVRVDRLAFFDIETTGLAGGTGTYVVLAGLGTFERTSAAEPPAFRLRQYFLADVAHEPAMLARLAADIARCDGLVTYNGRSFDVPVLEARLTLARTRTPCRIPHFDLLTTVRRLYRGRLPGCRLSDAERALLRFERPDDLPGALVPRLYFDYVRGGRVAPLRGVMRHNADDVFSLVGLLARLAAIVSAPDVAPDDAPFVARLLEREGMVARAGELYGRALPWLEGGPDWAWAARRHALLLRRSGEQARAAEWWERLWLAGEPAGGIELAKHLEHRERDFGAAANVVREMLRSAPPAQHETLQHRLRRLEARGARQNPRRL